MNIFILCKRKGLPLIRFYKSISILVLAIIALIYIAYFLKNHKEYSGNSFYGYSCKADCAGHRAGYNWAKQKGLTLVSECEGKSQSFIEGCIAWVD